ncbi:MAG TPA: carboxypeptidase-like regulatory domain-containing protein [Gemmataceae bacterium]
MSGAARAPAADPSGRAWYLAVPAALLGLSCSGNGGEELHPVRGKVLYKGEPAAGAVVIFHPRQGEGVETVRPTAVTGADGTFALATGRRPGAPPGEYAVTVTWPAEAQKAAPKKIAGIPDAGAPPPDRLNGRYARRSESGLAAQVRPGANDLEPFLLE